MDTIVICQLFYFLFPLEAEIAPLNQISPADSSYTKVITELTAESKSNLSDD